jgi:4-hydroxyphenylpyruvate dioxygenase
MSIAPNNPVGLEGIEYIEFTSSEPKALEKLFCEFGFSRTHQHKSKKIDLYQQGQIRILLNQEPSSFAHSFSKLHGPSLCSMGWRVHNAELALKESVSRGAKPATVRDHALSTGPVPAIYGIGDSLIYFVEGYQSTDFYERLGFVPHKDPILNPDKGFTFIDHLTNNVEKGTMAHWADYYKNIFGFTEVRYFDIRGVKTGLTSYALRSPCGTFCIPINEGTEDKSQINEYLREYKGPGVQHIAFATQNIIDSLTKLRETSIQTLDIDDQYYQEVFHRVPGVTEDRAKLKDLNILVDGDAEGYLLQIFTKNLVGPIFIEIIQRKNHHAFGEGNFGALFRSIERDQQARGVL